MSDDSTPATGPVFDPWPTTDQPPVRVEVPSDGRKVCTVQLCADGSARVWEGDMSRRGYRVTATGCDCVPVNPLGGCAHPDAVALAYERWATALPDEAVPPHWRRARAILRLLRQALTPAGRAAALDDMKIQPADRPLAGDPPGSLYLLRPLDSEGLARPTLYTDAALLNLCQAILQNHGYQVRPQAVAGLTVALAIWPAAGLETTT